MQNTYGSEMEWTIVVLGPDTKAEACTLLHISYNHSSTYIHRTHTVQYDSYMYVECTNQYLHTAALQLLSYAHLSILMGRQCYESHQGYQIECQK